MNTARKRYLITYDISDDKRRNRVFDTLTDHGDHAQYSVFICGLSPMELAGLRGRLTDYIHQRQDQILILDLGQAQSEIGDNLECVGRPYLPPGRVLVV